MCVADSEGGIGYIVGNSLSNEFGRRGLGTGTVCVLTQTVVDASDPAFHHPTKPIGSAFSAEEAELRRQRDGWSMVEEAGRGYRRVVPSPRPVGIVEAGAIKVLLDAGFVVVAAGGGGIPVIEEEPGVYRGVEAVIDKDLASAYLAASLGVPLLVISTGVEKRGGPLSAARPTRPGAASVWRRSSVIWRLANFPKAAWGPRYRAAIEFLEQGGDEVVITSLACLSSAITGRTGTHITR